jgi:hypothetical protein
MIVEENIYYHVPQSLTACMDFVKISFLAKPRFVQNTCAVHGNKPVSTRAKLHP